MDTNKKKFSDIKSNTFRNRRFKFIFKNKDETGVSRPLLKRA